jgi:PEP-CTERM motif
VFINALGFSSKNVLYGAGDSGFYTINTSTGAASLVANISGFNSSGDLVFDPVNNRFLGTSGFFNSTSDTLFSISLNGTATAIGSIGFSDVYGLFFENGTLFGYTANREQITIDLTTGAGTFNKNVTGGIGFIWGAASLPSTEEPKSIPEPSSTLGLLAFGAFGAGSLVNRFWQQKG